MDSVDAWLATGTHCPLHLSCACRARTCTIRVRAAFAAVSVPIMEVSLLVPRKRECFTKRNFFAVSADIIMAPKRDIFPSRCALNDVPRSNPYSGDADSIRWRNLRLSRLVSLGVASNVNVNSKVPKLKYNNNTAFYIIKTLKRTAILEFNLNISCVNS